MAQILNGQILCSLAMVLVGSTVVVSKSIGAEVEPFLATALRHALALPVFLLLMRMARVSFPRLGLRDAGLLLVQAAAGSVGYTVLLIHGVVRAGAAETSVVTGTLPAVSALFAVLFLGERPSRRLTIAIALATAGVVAVSLAPAAPGVPGHAAAAGHSRLSGIALVLAAIACEAVFILANRRLSRPVPALALSTLMSAGGLLLCLLPAWLSRSGQAAWPEMPGQAGLAGIAYYALVPTVGGFLLWYAGSARTSGARASLATVWMPVSALLLSALWLHEPIGAAQWLGLACVVLATVCASGGKA